MHSYVSGAFTFRPEDAMVTSFEIELGDIILTATDGLFDNMNDNLILKELSRIKVVNGTL